MPTAPLLGTATVHLLEAYVQEITPVPYLTGLFQSPPRNYFDSEMIQLDVFRDTEEIAIVLPDLSSGTRENELGGWSDKGFTPPVFDESATLTAYNMIKRQPGQNIFEDPDVATNATLQAFRIMRLLEAKIRRAVELQCAQVLQTGQVNLTDKAGRPLFTLDYQPRSAHFPTAGTAWSTASSGGSIPFKVTDLESLADQIATNGQRTPARAIFGKRAWADFFGDEGVRKLFDNRRISLGDISPQPVQQLGGAIRKGTMSVGSYELELFVYNGAYTDPQTSTRKTYVDQDSVIIVAEGARLDLAFGAIPQLRAPSQPALGFLPPRFSDGAQRFDLTINAYFTEDGRHLKFSCGTRPLAIPTAIDSFGCLKTR
jgi:hypothetical protein